MKDGHRGGTFGGTGGKICRNALISPIGENKMKHCWEGTYISNTHTHTHTEFVTVQS